jgi:hypothetical protein
MRADAVANRYLSVLKNAFLFDLIFYNIPFMIAHCLARLIITPRLGAKIIVRLLKKSPRVWRKRQRPKVRRDAMLRWFQWSDAQPTGQPRALRERLEDFQRVKEQMG